VSDQLSDNNRPPDSASPPTEAPLLVVGLGASAGGIAALKEFFGHVAVDQPIAYVAILHLSPDFESQLAQVLQFVAPFPVTQVQETTRIEPKHAYVISPNLNLRVWDGSLIVDPMRTREERKAPVDLFFRTLADSYTSKKPDIFLLERFCGPSS